MKKFLKVFFGTLSILFSILLLVTRRRREIA